MNLEKQTWGSWKWETNQPKQLQIQEKFKNDRPEGVRGFEFFQLLMQLVLMLRQQAEFQIDLFDILLELLLHNFQLKLKIV